MPAAQIPGLSHITDAARDLSRGPLGIIAFFILLVYLIAALVILFATLQQDSEYLLILFICVFPLIVFGGFCWLVAWHHEKLYPPSEIEKAPRFVDMILAMSGTTVEPLSTSEEIQVAEATEQADAARLVGVDPEKSVLSSHVLRFNDPEMRYFRSVLRDWSQNTKELGSTTDLQNPRQAYAIMQVLNFFESLGVATRFGRINKRECIEYFGSTVKRYWDRSMTLIDDIRRRKDHNTFQNFEWLVDQVHEAEKKETNE